MSSTARRPFAIASVLLLAACATGGHAHGLQRAHVERLYFGRAIGDTAFVTDSAWAKFVREVITPTFPDGATTWDAAGRWRAPDGTQWQERSFVVELAHRISNDVEGRVQHVMDAYKQRFDQQAVLRIVTEVWTNM